MKYNLPESVMISDLDKIKYLTEAKGVLRQKKIVGICSCLEHMDVPRLTRVQLINELWDEMPDERKRYDIHQPACLWFEPNDLGSRIDLINKLIYKLKNKQQ